VKAAARSITSEVELSGVGLHSGQTVHVRLRPALPGTGLIFVRTELLGPPRLGLADLWAQGPAFRTTLKRGPAEVHTVEHLLSAAAGLGLTDLQVDLDGAELPGMDGSALPFAEALKRAGPVDLVGSEVEVVQPARPVTVEDGQTRITLEPWPGGLRIMYHLFYPDEPLAQGTYSLVVTPESYLAEIAPARTFCLRQEAEALRAAGFGKGAGTHNTLVLDHGKVLNQTLRFPDEPVRHKISDLLGDLHLLGRPVRGSMVAERTGHRQNRALVAKLAAGEGG
jgi:UDP-3-O-acyl N-acetylglucosamine deacetylase